MEKILQNAMNGKGCSSDQAMWLATQVDKVELFRGATTIRECFLGNKVDLCMIVNAKCGSCSMNCKFCSQSSHYSTGIQEHEMLSRLQLLERISNIENSNVHHCGIVTSGGKLTSDDLNVICQAALEKLNGGHTGLCASLGRLNRSELTKLKESGVSRYHHNLETSKEYYPEICTTQTWQQRFDTVKTALEVGMEVCCGGLFGIGESWNDRISLAMSLRELGIRCVPLNFLHPHKGTPLEGIELLDVDEALRIIAVYRFILPTATLRICGGRIDVLKERQSELFAAGGNAIMTGNYLTSSGEVPSHDLDMIKGLGLELQS